MNKIKENIEKIKQQIAQASHATYHINNQQGEPLSSNRQKAVTLLAVSKTKPASAVAQAYLAGQRDFGENYLQEAVEKITELSHLPELCWHFIGPIQSNKTKQIAKNFTWVHSVDRAKVAMRLNSHRNEYLSDTSDENYGQDSALNICLQVNISEESSKSGILASELFSLAEVVNNCDKLNLRGLMAIPEKNASVASYVQMQHLFKKLQTQYPTVDTLSMGMSKDLHLAITHGSTMVRIGTAIFGERG
ncbi:MAG: YggS family pyridoxal phosphate-dependent enzyme [Colwellia sp.]|nr:YggS family pyridoxal phosphate-dependent enzyme [Colwellia sp.]